MGAVMLDGKALAAKITQEVTAQVAQLRGKAGLAVVLVGDDAASRVYVNSRRRDCEKCGIDTEEYVLGADATMSALLDVIEMLNHKPSIHGILVQFPLPPHLDARVVQLAIAPQKDVDCVNPTNMGRVLLGEDSFPPCTPAGVMRLLDAYDIAFAGKRAVVIGRSNIVGKPQGVMLMQRDATVSICHTKTENLPQLCRQADILVSAAGCQGLVTGDMIKRGAVVVDVGVNRDGQGKLHGDVCFAQAAQLAAYITPVPGGVGPVTRAMLMEHTLLAARKLLKD